MSKKILLIAFLGIAFLQGLSQSKSCKLFYSHKNVTYYPDWHHEYDYHPRPGVSRELIYHQELNSKDSALEMEIIYNRQGQQVIINRYAAETKEGVNQIDSFFYDDRGLLIRRTTRHHSCVVGWNTLSNSFYYDDQQREIQNDQVGNDPQTIITIYDSVGKIIKEYKSPYTGNIYKKDIHYYDSRHRQDSIQHYYYYSDNLGSTAVFRYDSLKNSRETYLRYPKSQKLRSRFQYNADSTLHALLITRFPSFNGRKLNNVESIIEYDSNKNVQQCIFYVNEKKKFIKKHYYFYF